MTMQDMLATLSAFPASHTLAPFRFPLHARVRWAGSPEPTQSWQIAARRYTERDISEHIEYLLCIPEDPERAVQWAYEPDLEEVT